MSDMIGTYYDNQAKLLDSGVNAAINIYFLQRETKQYAAMIEQLESHLNRLAEVKMITVRAVKAA